MFHKTNHAGILNFNLYYFSILIQLFFYTFILKLCIVIILHSCILKIEVTKSLHFIKQTCPHIKFCFVLFFNFNSIVFYSFIFSFLVLYSCILKFMKLSPYVSQNKPCPHIKFCFVLFFNFNSIVFIRLLSSSVSL